MFLQKCIPIHEWFLHFYGKVLDIPIVNGYRLKPVISSMHFLYLHFPNAGGTVFNTIWFYSLGDNALGDEGCRALAEALKFSQSLTTLE